MEARAVAQVRSARAGGVSARARSKTRSAAPALHARATQVAACARVARRVLVTTTERSASGHATSHLPRADATSPRARRALRPTSDRAGAHSEREQHVIVRMLE